MNVSYKARYYTYFCDIPSQQAGQFCL